MESPPVYLFRILTANRKRGEDRGLMYIIIRQPYAYLEEELRRAFKGQEDVRIVVDRRSGERRRSQQPAALERRKADRRTPKEEVIEVVTLRARSPDDAAR